MGGRGGAPGPRPGGTWPAHHKRVPPRCPRTAINSQRSAPAVTCEHEANAGFDPRATHANTLVMRSSAAPLPVLGPGGWVKAEVSHPVTRQPLRCGPARGPAGRIIPGPREPSERRGVLSVQLARLPHGSVLMVRRRSTVRFRNGAPAQRVISNARLQDPVTRFQDPVTSVALTGLHGAT